MLRTTVLLSQIMQVCKTLLTVTCTQSAKSHLTATINHILAQYPVGEQLVYIVTDIFRSLQI